MHPGTITAGIALALGVLVVACVDVTPVTELPPSDAGVDVSVSPELRSTSCFQCTSGAAETGPTCGAGYARCSANPRCLAMFLCGIPRDCYAPGHDPLSCLTACGAAAGITGTDDPAVGPFVALYGCATATCSAACSAAADAATTTTSPPDADASCEAPRGSTCPPVAGNCKGIGKPCTKGGGECNERTSCDRDLDPNGAGACVTVFSCTTGSCGNGATCCKSPTTQNVPLCMANQCLPADCTADP